MDENNMLVNPIYNRNMNGLLATCGITYIMGLVLGIFISNMNIIFRVFLCCTSIIPILVYCLAIIKIGSRKLTKWYRCLFFVTNFVGFNMLFFAGVELVLPLLTKIRGHHRWHNSSVTMGWIAMALAVIALGYDCGMLAVHLFPPQEREVRWDPNRVLPIPL
ncbi:hypothetical protein FRX31_005337 [Thalictrum thalictroides]|uniref:Uncharacterized protein n=1 Tax=Thalictrum thalictroides TaxID=46969 RepID=A0A7J6X5V9_THATH|nr:hypothetical protein FRX31_005337 [Thalictrum thalictroides]